jgi:hypothetical protein
LHTSCLIFFSSLSVALPSNKYFFVEAREKESY